MTRRLISSGKRTCRLAALGAILLAATHPARAQKPAAAQGFDAFKMVRSRNIFDPDRRPPPSQNGSSAASAVPLAQSDYVALTGTLVTNDKALAFFSGSRADFDKVLPIKEKIAGATITKIDHGSVTIERAGKTATVAVGWTVPLNGAASAPAPVPEAAPALPAFGASAPAATSSAPPPAGNGGGGSPLSVFGPAVLSAVAPGPPAGANPGAPAATPAPPAPPNEDVARMMRERRQREMQ
jgi:hypothetical protein